jgi:NADPH:quinone reductase-like Zn-dependent oxidoreductase
MAPTVQKAVIIQQDRSVALREIAVPKPGPDEILVKVVAAAQNPVDWKTALYGKRAGVVSGCDFSGIVEEIGSNVPHGLRSVGERIAGLVHGGARQLCGAFSEYLVTYADFVVHLPDTWSFEDAAQLGIAPLSALMALYDLLELYEFPWHESAIANPPTPQDTPHGRRHSILISGGASSVGQYAVQFAKLSGLYVIATASERNFSLVRSLGADVVVDYHDPVRAAKQIRDAAPGPIEHAIDCVSMGTSFEIVAASLDGKSTIAYLSLGSYPLVEGARILSGVVFDYFGKVRSVF